MRPILRLFPVLLLSSLACAAGAPQYTTSSHWQGSGLQGHAPGKPTFWTTARGAWAEWRPHFDGPVTARVFLHKIVAPTDNDPAVQITVRHAGHTSTRTLDFSAGPSGWVDLGRFDFAGQDDEGVRLTKTTANNITRISAVRFDLIEGSADAIQSVLLDEPTAGPLVEEEKPPTPTPVFVDLAATQERTAIERLARRSVVAGTDPTHFSPDAPLTPADFTTWLNAALAPLHAQLPPVPDGSPTLTPDRLRALLDAAVHASHKNLDWLPDHPITWNLPSQGQPITRASVCPALLQFVQHIVEAGPPADRQWKLDFSDNFDGSTLDPSVWRTESGSPGHILSSRWPENVVVDGGLLHLLTRKESRGGKAWTTGNVWTKSYKPLYGFFECRMKIGRATGLNNAFWLMTENAAGPYHFELDITESHYPAKNVITLHNWKGPHVASAKTIVTGETLSDDFHVYAAEWTDSEVVWYLDGHEIRRVKHDFARAPAPLRLSSAVGRFAGRITDALDKTEMQVDWVRAYKPLPSPNE